MNNVKMIARLIATWTADVVSNVLLIPIVLLITGEEMKLTELNVVPIPFVSGLLNANTTMTVNLALARKPNELV